MKRLLLSGTTLSVMRRCMTTAAAFLLFCAMAACATGHASAQGPKLYAVPTSQWRPGDPSLLALAMGTLASGKYHGRWCVWLSGRSGSGREPIVWPAGFRAQRHPLALLDSRGKIVARGGERIKFAGGVAPVRHRPCMLGQKEAFYANSYPQRMSD